MSILEIKNDLIIEHLQDETSISGMENLVIIIFKTITKAKFIFLKQ